MRVSYSDNEGLHTVGERLCEEVRKYPHLYNCSMKEYKDIYMGYNSWIEIVQTLASLGQERYCNLVQRACVEHLCTRLVTYQSLFKTNHITRRPSLKRLWGMQVQPISIWMGKHQDRPNCSLSLWLNFLFEITKEIWQLWHKCCFFRSNRGL